MGRYQIKDKPNRGLFVVLELRNRQTLSEVIENDRAVLISLAKLLNIESFHYEQFKNDDCKMNKKDKKFCFNQYLGLVASHANENAEQIGFLLLFVLAESEDVEKSIKFKIFDNNYGSRMDIKFSEVLRPFLAKVCDGLRGKPKVVMFHAPEVIRGQVSKASPPPDDEIYVEDSTPNHADFYICVSRPKEYRQDVKDSCETEPRFILLLYSILYNYPEYEINQVMSVLQRETLNYNKKMTDLEIEANFKDLSVEEKKIAEQRKSDWKRTNFNEKSDNALRLWNCSRLRKKLYLCPQTKKN